MIFVRLFFEFFQIGLFSIGGGMATLPFLYNLSARTGWFTSGDLANMVAISESTPGPIGINMSTYVGFTITDVFGGIIATLGLICPSIIIIIIISKFLNKFRDNPMVENVFYGLRPASVAMISAAGILVTRMAFLKAPQEGLPKNFQSLLSLFNWKAILLALILFFTMRKIKLHPLVFLTFSMVIGILFSF